jgi:hypothetical protein
MPRLGAATVRQDDIAASALRWLGRGQSYLALVREIAWTAVRAVGGSYDDLEWLSPLVEPELAERFDQLPRVAREAALVGRADHLRARPHDAEGADVSAELAAQDAVVEHLSTAYMDLLDWSVGLLQTRRAKPSRRARRRREPDCAPVQCEVPREILEGLALRSERPGWPGRHAA